jgi:8-oxo-dGTP pyrophosphatase MutT (NUDIX family)
LKLKYQLRELLTKDLPGEQAHQRMAPTDRPISSFAKENANSFKESSVAIILIHLENSLEIVLIQRPVYEGNHSGQISFPGGKREASDLNLYQTAIRECFEEIGVELEAEHYIGTLTPVFIPVSSFHVEANLFYLNEVPAFHKDEREVDSIFTIKIAELMDEQNTKTKMMNLPNNLKIKEVPYFDLENKVIWGATALILSELKEIIKQIKI